MKVIRSDILASVHICTRARTRPWGRQQIFKFAGESNYYYVEKKQKALEDRSAKSIRSARRESALRALRVRKADRRLASRARESRENSQSHRRESSAQLEAVIYIPRKNKKDFIENIRKFVSKRAYYSKDVS